ncbi:hypothetical protein B296_00027434 [Ensete ventricosum]|uniref:Uncharacterized protein n=1 Tax=Ensete ventricosum TaxID=4639 RepID=A0A426Z7C8_ENSVE|nr:hypothetical protein B296_00027434 [Ensete ventricosum]
MAAKRSESEGSSNYGGRRGQQLRWLRLRLQCDFVAAGGVGCSKDVAAIGGRRGSGVHGCCRGGQRRYGARDRCWPLQRKIAAGSFFAARIAAGCDHGGWQREVAVGSVVQREMRAAVEGIREWTKVRKRDFGSRIDGSKGLIGIGGGMLRIGAGCRRLRFYAVLWLIWVWFRLRFGRVLGL